MLENLPEPLVPADADLRDFSYMPLQFRRLFNSDGWMRCSDSEARAALALWCESWHQVPAGSLPNDDQILRRLAQRSDGRSWRHVKEFALRGWFQCSDGRLYHQVVSEIAKEAWDKLRLNKRMTERARKRLREKHPKTKSTTEIQRRYNGDTTEIDQKITPGTLKLEQKITPSSLDQNIEESKFKVSSTDSVDPCSTEDKRREEKGNIKSILSGKPDDAYSKSGDNSKRAKRLVAVEIAKRAIQHLNDVVGTRFRAGEANLRFAVDRILYDQATEQELFAVVDAKWSDCGKGQFDVKYLRPETLWNKTKFAGYVGQLNLSVLAATQDPRCVVLILGDDGKGWKTLTCIQAREVVKPEDVARSILKDQRTIQRHFPEGNLRNVAVEFKQFGQQQKHIFSILELSG